MFPEIAQTDGFAWLILDQTMIDESAVYQKYLDAGYGVKGETYEGLADAMEVPEEFMVVTDLVELPLLISSYMVR